MSSLSDSGSFLRRQADLPVLVLSLDYELFFGRSGSVEKCLFEPTDMFTAWAAQRGVLATFYIDAGMLCAMEREASSDARLEGQLERVKSHVSALAHAGHEIGLHIHPHWEDTRFVDGAWDFSNTRYKLAAFSDAEVEDIVRRYSAVLNELSEDAVCSYRAGGFCVEPFSRFAGCLQEAGITVDSSVVPGMLIADQDKGVAFRDAPKDGWWLFSESPLSPAAVGEFVEVPITPVTLPVLHYWHRAFDRVLGRKPPTTLGDGSSKPIGTSEIFRRLTGRGRTSELSIDAAKAGLLGSSKILREERDTWHVMGHPKLLGQNSLDALDKFIDRKKIGRVLTVAEMAGAVRAQTQ